MLRRALRPTDSLNIPIRFFKMFGFWHLGGKYQHLYYIYGKFIYLFFIVCYGTCQLISVFLDWGNLNLHDMADGIYLTLTIICLIFKVGLLNKKNIMAIIEFQNCNVFTSQQRVQDCYIIDAMKATKRNSIGIIYMGSIISTLWNVGPLLNGAYKQKILPFRAWYPIPQTMSPYYEMAYTYQYFGILFCAWINLSSDAIMAGLMTLTCGQLQVLKHALRNLRNKAIANLGYFSEICKLCDNNEKLIWKCSDPVHLTLSDNILEQEICKELQNCITHHCAILEFIKNYEATFSASMFSQFAASLIIICITAFEISIITPFTTQFIAIFLYMLNVVAQILFYCWYGNEIYLTSLTLNDDLYFSDWYYRGPRIKKMMLIMMERCKQPIILKAGKLFTLSLDTFTSILRSTYSFYAVLQRIDIDINLDEVLSDGIPIENQ